MCCRYQKLGVLRISPQGHVVVIHGGCSKGPCQGETIGNDLLKRGSEPNREPKLWPIGDRYFEQLPDMSMFRV